MADYAPHSRHPLHVTAARLADAFLSISAQKPKHNVSSAPLHLLRPIIAYGLSDARAAVQAASAAGLHELAFLSPRGIAGTLGPEWFRAIIARAAAEDETIRITAILHCAGYEGHVMAALQAGMQDIYFTGDALMVEKLSEMAAQKGARLYRSFGAVLDLKHTADPATACRDWFDGPVLKMG